MLHTKVTVPPCLFRRTRHRWLLDRKRSTASSQAEVCEACGMLRLMFVPDRSAELRAGVRGELGQTMKYHSGRDRRTVPDDGARKRTASRIMVMRLRVEITTRARGPDSEPSF